MTIQVTSPRGRCARQDERDCPLHVSRVVITIIISLILCLSALSSCCLLEASAQLAPNQPSHQPRIDSPAEVAPNSIKIRKQQQQQQQQRQIQFRYPRESNATSTLQVPPAGRASKNETNKQTTPTFKPPLLIETTTGVPRVGLIARTSDAIYKTLSGYFSQEDEANGANERAMFGSKLTTTPQPTAGIKMTTKWPETTTTTVRNMGRRTTLTGGSWIAQALPQTTSAPRSKMTTVPHLDLGSYTDQTSIAPMDTKPPSRLTTVTTKVSGNFTTTTTTTSRPKPSTTRHVTTTLSPPTASSTFEPATLTHKPSPFSLAGPQNLNLTAHTPTQGQPPPSTSVVSQRAEFFSFLSQAIRSIYSLNEFAPSSSSNRNRSTRLAPLHSGEAEHENEETTEASPPSLPQANAASDNSIQANASLKQRVVSTNTREDILFLCKLLHKHLDSGRKNQDGSVTLTLDGALAANLSSPSPAPAPSPSPSTTSTSKPAHQRESARPTESPLAGSRLIGDPKRELSESQHEDRLLESTFALELRQHDNRSHEKVAEELLDNLYNLAHRRKLMMQTSEPPRVTNEAHEDESSASYQPEVDTHPLAGNISLIVWGRATTGARLRLVYWLLERVRVHAGQQARPGGDGANLRASSSSIRYKVLDLQDARELLDQLGHARVQQVIDNAMALVRPMVLLAAHKRGSMTDDLSSILAPPLVLDDSLVTNSPNGGSGGELTQNNNNNNNNNRTTLHLLLDKLMQSTFSDNLYLYSILFLLALFLLIICFAVPALCCSCMMPESVADTKPGDRRAAHRRLPMSGRNRGNRQQAGRFRPASHNDSALSPAAIDTKSHFRTTDPLRESISSISGALSATTGDGGEGKKLAEGAIWRKLSNSTTTLTNDQVRSLEDGGQINVSIVSGNRNHQQPSGRQNNNSSKFEWYTFEDNRTLHETTSSSADSQDRPGQTVVVRDQRKLTKSIQTYQADDPVAAAGPGPVGSPESGAKVHFNDSIDREHLSMAYRDRLETRNSDTLTKSELVMLKEKLIPIGRQLRVRQQQEQNEQHVATNGRPHDYVNTGQPRAAAAAAAAAAAQVARHIDSTSVESGPGDRNGAGSADDGRSRYIAPVSPDAQENEQRAPSMRYLELPVGGPMRVGGIRDELKASDSISRSAPAKVRVPTRTNKSTSDQQQWQLPGDTYKRYDVI